jgi:Family of unknown function (DUF6074)
MAMIIPFPLARRVGQIRKQAQSMAWRSQDTAERYLEHYLDIQRETLMKRGIDAEVIAQQCRHMEVAIRCQLTRVLNSGSAA